MTVLVSYRLCAAFLKKGVGGEGAIITCKLRQRFPVVYFCSPLMFCVMLFIVSFFEFIKVHRSLWIHDIYCYLV